MGQETIRSHIILSKFVGIRLFPFNFVNLTMQDANCLSFGFKVCFSLLYMYKGLRRRAEFYMENHDFGGSIQFLIRKD